LLREKKKPNSNQMSSNQRWDF